MFGEFRRELHVIKDNFIPPRDWIWVAGLDWGYRDPSWYGLFAVGPEDRTVLWWEWMFKQLDANDAGRKLGMAMLAVTKAVAIPHPSWIAYDDQMDQVHGHEGPTLAEQFSAGLREVMGGATPTFRPAPKGPGSRQAKLQLLHQMLPWEPDKQGHVQVWGMPKLRIHERCVYWLRTVPALPYGSDPHRRRGHERGRPRL